MQLNFKFYVDPVWMAKFPSSQNELKEVVWAAHWEAVENQLKTHVNPTVVNGNSLKTHSMCKKSAGHWMCTVSVACSKT